MWRGLKVYSGICPDPECHTKLYFPSYASSSVECTGCGQHHGKESLLDIKDVHDPDLALRNLLRSALLGQNSSKTTPDLVKVKGYSNYHCKLLSPLLTFYGMEKRTGEVKLLRELSQVDMFDCSLLGDRAFQIESEHVETAGYGRDKTGSAAYLKDTLEAIKIVNDNEERLIPVHVDGDGHCLVHAISRALVGRELFWHALRANLKNHLETEILKYKGVFRDFIDDSEWEEIISEADPYFQPPEGQGLGLRNIHLFGLANVLHRPIILLDSVSGMQSCGDYSGIFLPALIPVDECKSKDNILNRPLAVAWSSLGRNHFIPLVGVKGKPVPKLPQWLIPKAWGIPDEVVKQYMEFDSHGHCFIGGQRCLQDKYIQRLVKAMDDLFLQKNSIAAHLVTEVHQFVYKPSGMVGVKPEVVTMAAQAAIANGRLYRCLSCYALRELYLDISADLLKPGGDLYSLAAQSHGLLQEGVSYSFPSYQGLVCVFDAERDVLEPIEQKDMALLKCHLCHGLLRRVRSDGSVVFVNGDRTTTPVKGQSRCGCGFKHYWNGKEYDNMPEFFPISLEWGGKTVSETVYWFQYEADPSYNSNVYDVATKLVQKHFPGEFGSERLVQKVVDTILRQTAKKEGALAAVASSAMTSEQSSTADTSFTPSKIILTGEKKKTFHREELTKSETERVLKTRTEHHAAIMQKRRSGEEAKKAPEKGVKIAKQQSGTKPHQDSSPPSQGVSKDTPALSSSAAQSAVARTDKKVQLSTSDGKRRMLIIAVDTTFKQLQELIERELGIPPGEQKIRYGFPPCELQPPEEGHGEDPVPLQHNDRVMVEHLKPAAPDDHPPDIVMGGDNNVAMASALIDALGTLTGGDMWEAAQNCHEMFDKEGYYYNMVAHGLGPLYHNQHCTIPGFPNKVFVYNATKDRLELCLGERHIQVQPLDDETLMLANTRSIQAPTVERSSGLSSEASFSGAIGHRDTSHSRVAFSGQGRTLSGTPTSKKNPAESLPKPTSTNQASELALPLEPRTALISSIDPQVDLSEGELQKLAVEDNAATQEEQITGSTENATITKQMREKEEEAMENKANTNEMPVETPKSEAMETDQSESEVPSSSGLESSDDSTRGEGEELRENQNVVETGAGAQGSVVVDQSENEKIVKGDKENASEGMETEQFCVAQDVTPVSVTPLSTGDAEVTERQEVEDIATSNTNLPETNVTDDQVNSGSSDDPVTQVSVAMEIDNQPGSSPAESSTDKPEVEVNDIPTDSGQETEILNSVDSKELKVLEEDEVGSTDDSGSLKKDYEAKKSSETETPVKLQDTIAVDGRTSDQMIQEKSE